jgi:hypothetical protein
MTNPLFVGIDVSKRDNHVQFLNGSGEKLNCFKVDNNQTGVLERFHKETGKIKSYFYVYDIKIR